ncbi:Cell division control protein 2-like protein [Hypsibius exemplaris]|uniref:cyclin-dependent kinase n=1 Tax=Hypsibius exemplaris TaxID=2072580 RepID=A0A1W0WIU0_HYPEX|nr:Cell division control protein 2-like protein [Hypsibius exemplaris]
MSHHPRKRASGETKKRQQTPSGNASFHQEEPAGVTQIVRKFGLADAPGSNHQGRSSPSPSPKIYKLTSVIGEGTYGVVHRGVDTRNGRMVAIKQMAMDPEGQGLPSVALREITHLGEMSHKNIVNMLDLVVGEKHMMVIFEHLDMDLREFQTEYIKKYKYFSFDMVQRITYQMLLGLGYIHSCSVIHRDMKPQNVLVDKKTLAVKISDFGLARTYTTPLHEMTVEVVTLWYRSPELLLGSDMYTTSADVWSLGVMIIELLENNCPFDPDSEIRALHLIFETLGTPSSAVWKDFPKLRHSCDAFPKWIRKPWKEISPHAPSVALNLIEQMLVYEPKDRITCSDAIAHSMFDHQHGGGDVRDGKDTKPFRAGPPQSPLSPQARIVFEERSSAAATTQCGPSGMAQHPMQQVNATTARGKPPVSQKRD